MQQLLHKIKQFSHTFVRRPEFILLTGVALVIIGAFLAIVFPMLLGLGLDMNFKLTDGKFIFKNWQELPIPILTKIYLFDIQNPNEFSQGAIPVIREVGPYVYKEYKTREIIEWSEDNKRVKYYETLQFEFDPDLSYGRLDDTITLVNVPLLIIFSIINSAVERFPLTPIISPIVNNVINTLLATHRERLLETRTVGEVLNGRRITFLDTIDIVAKPLRLLGLPIPEYGTGPYKLRDNQYGFLAIRNNSKFGPFETLTGEGSRDQFDKYVTYKNKPRLGVYRHESCDALNGTDGSFFGTFVDNTQPLYLFNIHACRSFRLNYAGDTSANGVTAYRYEFPDTLFDGPQHTPENWCFCPAGVDGRKCHGILDLSQCLDGVPFAMTYPHFLNSPRFMTGVRGLTPDRDKHLGFFDIEPTLGITLKGSGRFQINLKLRPFSFVPGLNEFRQTLLPYLWIDEGAEVGGWMGTLIKAGSYSINGAGYGFILTILLGIGISMIGSYMKFKGRSGRKSPVNPYVRPTKPDNNNNNHNSLQQLQVNGLTKLPANLPLTDYPVEFGTNGQQQHQLPSINNTIDYPAQRNPFEQQSNTQQNTSTTLNNTRANLTQNNHPVQHDNFVQSNAPRNPIDNIHANYNTRNNYPENNNPFVQSSASRKTSVINEYQGKPLENDPGWNSSLSNNIQDNMAQNKYPVHRNSLDQSNVPRHTSPINKTNANYTTRNEYPDHNNPFAQSNAPRKASIINEYQGLSQQKTQNDYPADGNPFSSPPNRLSLDSPVKMSPDLEARIDRVRNGYPMQNDLARKPSITPNNTPLVYTIDASNSNRTPSNKVPRQSLDIVTDNQPQQPSEAEVEAGMRALAGQVFAERLREAGGDPSRIYPDLVKINREVHTLVKAKDVDELTHMRGVGDTITRNNGRKASVDSQESQRSVIGERHSGHTVHNEVMLPPVEDGDTHTTVIIQRMPYGHEVIR